MNIASSPRLVLASASPRRREILEALGLAFEVVVPDAVELIAGEPRAVVLENARRKARTVHALRPDDLVLGADTEVTMDGRVLGKAAGEAQARKHLAALAGRPHEVLGGIVLLDPDGRERSGVASSMVTFGPLDAGTIELYVASGEWRDRAGAYAIQGLGSMLIERLEGDFSNVVGLSVPLLLALAPELRPPAGNRLTG